MKFAISLNSCFNWIMRNTRTLIKEKLISKYLEDTNPITQSKSTDINVLLNRVKNKEKSESRKKLYFSAVASTGLLLFGLIIF